MRKIGATSLEVTLSDGSIQTFTATTPPWTIPDGLSKCFSVRIRAVSPLCPDTNWSEPFNYCPEQNGICEKILIICGCCSDGRSAEESFGVPVIVVSEDEMLALLKTAYGPSFSTLKEALGQSENVGQPVFSIRPNPANTILEVKFAGRNDQQYEVYLYDILGRECSRSAFMGSNSSVLNVSNLPQGFYVLIIKDSGGKIQYKKNINVLH